MGAMNYEQWIGKEGVLKMKGGKELVKELIELAIAKRAADANHVGEEEKKAEQEEDDEKGASPVRKQIRKPSRSRPKKRKTADDEIESKSNSLQAIVQIDNSVKEVEAAVRRAKRVRIVEGGKPLGQQAESKSSECDVDIESKQQEHREAKAKEAAEQDWYESKYDNDQDDVEDITGSPLPTPPSVAAQPPPAAAPASADKESEENRAHDTGNSTTAEPMTADQERQLRSSIRTPALILAGMPSQGEKEQEAARLPAALTSLDKPESPMNWYYAGFKFDS